MVKPIIFPLVVYAVLLAACTTTPIDTSDLHIQESIKPEGKAPALHQSTPLPPPPSNIIEPERFTVVVNDVPAKELLFAMARDAGLDADISADVTGRVTLNALDITFNQLLERIAAQAPLRFSHINGVIKVEADTAFLKHYDVSYVSMGRVSESKIAIATEVSTTGGGETLGNVSSTSITNTSKHEFWEMLKNNISSILDHHERQAVKTERRIRSNNKQTDISNGIIDDASALKTNMTQGALTAELEAEPTTESTDGADDASTENGHPNLMLSPESGVLSVFGTQKLHQEIATYLAKILKGAQRQVFIEATIVEVELNDDFQAGVDWSRLVIPGTDGFSFTQALIGTNLGDMPVNTLQYRNTKSDYTLASTVKLLSEFGNTKVLSTPKILALNNQTALLKVVDNRVYFTINVETETTETGTTRTFESVLHTLPVGLVMSVTPQTSDNGDITLNVRPTISRILRFVKDPNPALGDTESFVPEVSVREIETILRVQNGDIAVIGGLMQDNHSDNSSGLPTASKIPWLGGLFGYEERKTSKSELVIFIKPIVVENPTLNGEFSAYKRLLNNSSPATNQKNSMGTIEPEAR